MTKSEFRKQIDRLPESINEVNEVLDDQDIIMIDFMDGEQVLNIEYNDSNEYTMLGIYGDKIGSSVDKNHIQRNIIKS